MRGKSFSTATTLTDREFVGFNEARALCAGNRVRVQSSFVPVEGRQVGGFNEARALCAGNLVEVPREIER